MKINSGCLGKLKSHEGTHSMCLIWSFSLTGPSDFTMIWHPIDEIVLILFNIGDSDLFQDFMNKPERSYFYVILTNESQLRLVAEHNIQRL